jgi:hypothetical protein
VTISIKTHKMLWGRAANRCSICRLELVMNAGETDDEALIGDACHIVARESTGPRGNSPLTSEERDKYSNLILLCKVHHKLADDQPGTYTVEHLQETKASHEKWVRESLEGFSPVKQREDEFYAHYVDEWARYAHIETWQQWSSFVLSAWEPSISISVDKQLEELRYWLLSRIWPGRYVELESAFDNFRQVLGDFQTTFHMHAERPSEAPSMFITRKFYNTPDWDPDRYDRLLLQYEYHVHLVQDLMLELARAANYVCDRVRQFISPIYRLNEGVILVETGPHSFLTYQILRTEYRGDERTTRPYPGLEEFKRIRETRDFHFGAGGECQRP